MSEKSMHSEVDNGGCGRKKVAGLPREVRKEELREGQQDFFPPEIPSLGVSFLGPRRVLFLGGSYIPGHTSTMDDIAYASGFWSKGQNDFKLFSFIKRISSLHLAC